MAISSQNRRVRLDVLVVSRQLALSREAARRLIMAGEVLANDQVMTKPGTMVPPDIEIRIKSRSRYVSRGGDKLAAALAGFSLNVSGLICADVGASTGGFTDCLLQAGVRKVYAIDVGHGQLAWRLRQDTRVVVMERVNARYLTRLPEPIDIVCIDASFISLKLLLPNALSWMRKGGDLIALVKPQFEAGRSQVGKKGVVRDAEVHYEVLNTITQAVVHYDWNVSGLMPSPLRGPAGNLEFLIWVNRSQSAPRPAEALIRDALEQAASMA